jgi:hypothetical protein
MATKKLSPAQAGLLRSVALGDAGVPEASEGGRRTVSRLYIPNPLSDRQVAALRVRAHFVGPATGDMRQGVRDASAWLADRLQDYPQYGERAELRKVLREYAVNQVNWDVSAYEDGQAAVLDDVLAIIDGHQDTINELIQANRDAAKGVAS